MISVSDNQLRIVDEAADRLPAEARGTFLRRVVAEVREGRSFKDSDIERAVRVTCRERKRAEAGLGAQSLVSRRNQYSSITERSATNITENSAP